jgi:hypothetical protein
MSAANPKFNEKVFENICLQLERDGKSIPAICKDNNSNINDFYAWLRTGDAQARKEKNERYARARELYVENRLAYRDEINEEGLRKIENCDPKIANAISSHYRELARQIEWELSKIMPKKYGERLALDADEGLRVIISGDKGKI